MGLMRHTGRPSPFATIDAVSAIGRCRGGCFAPYTVREQLRPVKVTRTCGLAQHFGT